MKKCLKITALCCFFVLLLTIMLAANIPKTYANSTGAESQFYNEYKPDYVQFVWYYYNEYISPYARVELPYVVNKTSGVTGVQSQIGNFWSNDTESYELVNFDYFIDSTSNNNIPIRFNVDCDRVIFYWDYLIFATDNVPVIQFTNNEGITDYSYSFKVGITESGPSYSSSMAEGSILNFGNILNQLPSQGSGVKLYRDVTITFDCSFDAFCEIVYTTTYRTESNQETKSDLLLNSGIITPIPPLSENNFGTWLLESLNSFLSFELFPGFSLSGLLALLVGIPLLLWLFKMLFGG